MNVIVTLMVIPLRSLDYTHVGKRAKSVNVSFKTPIRGEVAQRVIDASGLTVFGGSEWSIKK
ncbi:transposase [Edwardsiella tarda]|nr:transposase [Edwardsiella tarda]